MNVMHIKLTYSMLRELNHFFHSNSCRAITLFSHVTVRGFLYAVLGRVLENI